MRDHEDSTSGWTHCEMHQTRLDSNVVSTHTEDLSTSDQYTVTVGHQEMIQNSFRYSKFRMSGKYTCAIQDLRPNSGRSSKEDWSREEGRRASSQLWTLWRSRCPSSWKSSRMNLEWCTTNIQKTRSGCSVHICPAPKLNISQTGTFAITLDNTMPSESGDIYKKKEA